MEETFAQIAGAAQHSIADVNVSITEGGSIVGHGVSASSNAIRVCGGKLDAILQSFGGIEGGDETVGGKSASLLRKVGALGVKAGGEAMDKLAKLKECVDKMEKVASAAQNAGLGEIAEHYKKMTDELRPMVESKQNAVDTMMAEFKHKHQSAIEAIGSLKPSDDNSSKAGIMSLTFTQVNDAHALAKRVKNVIHALNGEQSQIKDQALEHVKTANDAEFIKALNELLECMGHTGAHGGLEMKTQKLVDRLHASRNEVRKIINSFIDAFAKDINGISDSAEAMTKQFGKAIDYDEKTVAFLDHFTKLASYLSDRKRQSKIYQHLLELNVDQVDSKEIKDRFLSTLRILAESATAMDTTSASNSFAQHCRDVISTVGRYGDMMKSHRDSVKKQGGSSMDELFSVDASKIDIGTLLAPLERLNVVIKKIKFFRNIAIFRSNLQQTSRELTTYTKDYHKSVGQAIGDAISKIKTDYGEIIAQIDDNKSGMGLEIDMYNESQPNNKKISKEKLKQMYKYQCDARMGLYKTVEAIDLYLLHFTESISKNPDAVADLHKMLVATKIIAKWYDNKAGDNLIRMFESFSETTDVEAADFMTKYDNGGIMSDLSFKLTGDKAVKAYERARRAMEGVVVLKNIISYFITIGEKYGDMKNNKNILMAPSNIYKNLVNYIWVSAIDLSTTGTDILDDDNKVKRVLTYEDTKASLAMINSSVDPETFGINFNKHSIDKLRLLKCQQEVTRLKNSVSSTGLDEDVRRMKQCVTNIFARLGKTEYIFSMLKFGVYDLSQMDKTMFIQFVAELRKLLLGNNTIRFTIPGTANPVTINKTAILQPDNIDQILATNPRDSVIITINNSNGDPKYTFKSISEFQKENFSDASTLLAGNGINDNNNQINVGGFLRQFLAGIIADVDRRHLPRALRLTTALQYVMADMMNTFKQKNQNSVFAIDDTYFVLTMKAIAGKVLAVTGVNRLLKDPNSYKNIISKNQARLIMGGADGDNDIIDNAVELYIRLPLLVEFYRMIFDNGNKEYVTDSVTGVLDEERISFVPEVGNVWSGLIINIFEKSKHIQAGVYTVENMAKIVSEVNSIYKHYKGSVNDDELVRHIMTQLVAEINRRYGVIKRQELLQYYRVVNATKRANYGSEVVESNYSTNDLDILNEELEFEKNSPSDEFIKLKETMKDASTPMETKINRLTDYKIMKEFRERIDVALSREEDNLRVGEGRTDFLTIVDRVRLLKKSIMSKSSRTEKYEMIIQAIEESNNINQFSNDIFTCFHEFVVMPLRTAYQMHNALNVFMGTVFKLVTDANFENELLQSNVGDGNLTLKQAIADFAAAQFSSITVTNAQLVISQHDPSQNSSTSLLKALVKFSNNSSNLVKLSISTTNRISIDFSEYQRVCEHLVANVKYMVDKFTGLVPSALLDKVTDADTEGSVYWLEKKMISETFNKIEKSERSRAVGSIDNITKLMPIVSSIVYTKEVKLSELLSNLILKKPQPPSTSEAKECMPIIRDAFMTYNRDARMFITPNTSNVRSSTKISNLLFNPLPNTSLVKDSTNGIIQEFNGLIANYLNDLYDSQGRKMYTKVYSNFANSALIDALNGQSFPDFGTNVFTGWYALGTTPVIFSATLAYVMKVLSNRSNPATNMKIHELNSIQDISPNILEKYRMHLPMYIRLFKLFIEKCKVYRRVIDKMSIAVDQVEFSTNPPNTNVREFDTEADQPFVSGFAVLNIDASVKNLIVLHLDLIVNSMSSLLQDAETVHQELLETDSTVPLYFDVKKDFTKTHMNSTGSAPFAPLSILAMGFPNTLATEILSPVDHKSSIINKKFLYGMRSLLLNKFELSSSKLPYVKKLLTDFNGYTSAGSAISEKKFNEVLTHVSSATNYIYDLRFFSGNVDMLQSVSPSANSILTYQEKNQIVQSLTLVESINVIDSSDKVANHIKAGQFAFAPISDVNANANANSRQKVIMVNIVDLNIMPINVHSLMREIPLANLYNYAMTFDSIVKEMQLNDFFKELLVSPYKALQRVELNDVQGVRFLDDVLNKRIFMAGDALRTNAQRRLDSKIFRNLSFLSLIQHAIKQKVKSELEFINTRVVSNTAAVGTIITALADDNGNAVDENLFEF